MATPTYEELLEGSTLWRKKHKGIDYLLSHHGYRGNGEQDCWSDFDNHPGIWCYYLVIPKAMFPNRWDDFAVVDGKLGQAWKHDWFDTEISWHSKEISYDHNFVEFESVKVGCDYGHLHQSERGYPDTYQSVNRDAIRTVEAFVEANPDRLIRCPYNGVYYPESEITYNDNGNPCGPVGRARRANAERILGGSDD